MSELTPIKDEDRRVANIHKAEYTPFYSGGKPDGSVLQLNKSNALGTGFHIYKMEPGETTVAHEHLSDEEFLMLEGEIFDHDGTRYGPGDLVWLRKGTEHYSHSPNGCIIAVYLEGEKPIDN